MAAIYALANKCSTLHIIPAMEYSPSLCGFSPTANRGGTPSWKVIEKAAALGFVTRTIKVCEKCEQLYSASASDAEGGK